MWIDSTGVTRHEVASEPTFALAIARCIPAQSHTRGKALKPAMRYFTATLARAWRLTNPRGAEYSEVFYSGLTFLASLLIKILFLT